MRKPPAVTTLFLALLAATASAQYKVVAPDGRVTYTDRPPADAALSVTEVNRRKAVAEPSPKVSLPAELQRIATRFPVTLFTTDKCPPCDRGRALLLQRGVPYTERQIISTDDVAALERTIGGRSVPALTVGGQALRGFSAGDWASYLDAAGYPRESRLPAGWTPPAPLPLVAPAPKPEPATQAQATATSTPTPTPAPTPAPARPVESTTSADGTSAIRF